jgi:alpha-L-rhamnosidase
MQDLNCWLPRIRRLILLSAFFLLFPVYSQAEMPSPVRIDDLSCEHLQNPIGIGDSIPRLSWKLRSERRGEAQTAYQIQAAFSDSHRKNKNQEWNAWDSGKVISSQSILVAWSGKSLTSRSRVVWRVRVWDKDERPSNWSEPASFELGLLDPQNEWKGKWITADLPRYDIEQTTLENAQWIYAGSSATQVTGARYVLDLPGGVKIRKASIDVAADGLITTYINEHATHHGSSSRTAPLQADIGKELTQGKNIIAIASAAVRNAGRDGGATNRNAIAAHGWIELNDGRRFEFNTDNTWKAAVAPAGNWFATNFNDAEWPSATVLGTYSIARSRYVDNTIGPGRYLRKQFACTRPIAKARLYATALGLYEVYINGRRVNRDSTLDPGWTDYSKRVMVQTYDVTRFLSRDNAVGVILGDGWFAGRVGWMGLFQYGSRPVFNGQLQIDYTDGSTEIIATDSSWQAGSGEIIGSDMQWGEIIDARKETSEWDEPGFRNANWANAVIEQHDVALVPQKGPPVRNLLEVKPSKINQRGNSWIVDFGQNLVGHVRLSARGIAGTKIRLRHAETLASDGSLYTENLRPALSTDTFILKGSRREIFEPHFTFHGFRYVEISDYPGHLSRGDLSAIVVGSDTPSTGTWECSDPDLNRLFQNIVWSQRGNFLSVPTDCPQRDERLGWMGDAQVFAPTAAYNAGVAAFFSKWMIDVNDGQSTNGDYADFSPRVARPQPAWPVWGDAGIIIPWTMYLSYGDKRFLADSYSAMVRWLELNVRRSNHLILGGGVGDHLAPQRTPVEVVDTAYLANSAQIVAKAASILGRTEDALRYNQLSREISEAFNNAFVSTNGMIRGDTQTSYILALRFNLLPENLRSVAAERLAENVERNGHLSTGFVGVGLICPTLTDVGRSDLAWGLLLTNTYPSWLFSVKNGATTIWERWDGWTPERGFQDSSMNSFNHYSFGSVGAWLYSGAAGIRPDESQPGYKHFLLSPQFTSRLSQVKATFDSPYGLIDSHWHTEGNQMIYEATIPPNSSADLLLPVSWQHVRQSGRAIAVPDSTQTRVTLPAGSYRFSFLKTLLSLSR